MAFGPGEVRTGGSGVSTVAMLATFGVFVVVALISAVMVILGPRRPAGVQSPVVAIQCQQRMVRENFARADLVLTGTVFAVTGQGADASVHITPASVFKGRLPDRGVTIAARATGQGAAVGTATGDLHFQSDQPPYLLFLRQRSDGRYNTSRCDGSRLLGSGLTGREQKVLEAGATVVPRQP